MQLDVKPQILNLRTPFATARGPKSTTNLVTVTLTDGMGRVGRGECAPISRYQESMESVCDALSALAQDVKNGMTRQELQSVLPAGAARNALDCAFWDIECQWMHEPIWRRAHLSDRLRPVETLQTLSLDTPERMAAAAASFSAFTTLKIKLGGDFGDDLKRLEMVHHVRPDAALIVDANEGWDVDQLQSFIGPAALVGVKMIEQPLPAAQDNKLLGIDRHGILICGDESVHTEKDITERQDRYDMVNIKLDKSGGLTHALDMVSRVKEINTIRATQSQNPLKIMVGCMVGTSLAMAPAIVVAQSAQLADLDGASWLEKDVSGCVQYAGNKVQFGTKWGCG
ncbi:MAG: dipeptide epimerase [Pseudobdellovibrionaceae bacterium]